MPKSNSERSGAPALVPPRGSDPKWREKVESAQQARRMSARARAGKPSSFRSQVGRTVV